jgi:Flp pilus assembly protein TadD
MKRLVISCGILALVGLVLAGCAGAKPTPKTAAVPLEPNTAESGDLAKVETSLRQAQLKRQSGDLDGATKILAQLLLAAPDDPRVLGEYGKVLVSKGRADDALDFLKRAITLQPNDWTFYSAQGIAYDQRRNYQEAQLSYQRALALKPDDPTILSNAALSQMQAGDLDTAFTLLTRAAATGDAWPQIASNLELVRKLKEEHPKTEATMALPEPVHPQTPEQAPTPVKMTPVAVVKQVVPSMPPQASAQPKKTAASIPSVAPEPQATQAQTAAKATSPRDHAVYVQAGAYSSSRNARQVAAQLDSLGARVIQMDKDGHALYRVRIGPFNTVAQADAAREQARVLGFASTGIVSE